MDLDNNEFMEAMERDFQHVIAEMSGDQSIQRFRDLFQKLYDNLRKSHENEKAIWLKCKSLNNSISEGLTHIKLAEGHTKKDAQSIQSLDFQLEKAKAELNRMQAQEDKDKARIENLQTVIKDLQLVIKESEGVQSGKTSEIQKLTEEATLLLKEKDQLEVELESLMAEKGRCEQEKKVLANAHASLRQDFQKEEQLQNETKERLEKDQLRAIKQQEEIQKILKDKESIQNECRSAHQEIDERNNKNSMLKQQIEKLMKECEEKENTKAKMAGDNAKIKEKVNLVKAENEEIERNNKERDDEIKRLNGQLIENTLNLAKARRDKEKLITEIQRIDNEVGDARKIVEMLTTQAMELQREIEHTDKTADKDQGLVDNLLRDQNTIRKDFISVVKQNEEQQKKLEDANKNCDDVNGQVDLSIKIVQAKLKEINDKELEKERHIKEAKMSMKKYLHLSEEIKLKNNLISEFLKKTQETEAKLKRQQQLYEAVRSDRNLYSKNLTETQDKIAEIKLRYKVVMHQISQLKEEIEAKEKALNQQYFKAKDAEKSYQNLKKENEQLKTDIDDRKQTIMNLKNEIGKLQFIIKESESSRQKLKHQYESVVSERDILGTQLIRRNDELALTYERIQMQQNTLAKGEAEYRERVSDIEILDNTIKDLMRELSIYKRRASDIGNFYAEIDKLGKELVEEKLKVKGLSEELENPKNKYRWRNLEGSDCDTNELISKIENLQKRLIAKTEEVVAKDLMINTQEQTIKNLEQVMSKQPGLAEAEEISYYQQMIKSRTRKLMSLAAELNMYQAQSNEYKYEIEKLTSEVEEVKKTLYDIRRREQLMLEQDRREQREIDNRAHEDHIQMI